MKKILFLLTIVLSTGLFFIPNISKADVNNFTISNFEVDYYLTKDTNSAAKLKTTEVITAQFPNYDQNHGILRAIPKKYLDKNLHLNVVSVTNQSGAALNYTTYTENDNLVLKIGDADQYVRGQQVYKITYEQDNVVRFFDDHDEWYWNVNGTDWQQQVAILTARIHIPNSLVASLKTDRVCYTGAYDSKESSCSLKTDKTSSETIITLNTDRFLNAGETATFVLAFNKSTFMPLKQTFWETYGAQIKNISKIIITILIPLVTFVIVFKKWRKYGRDPRGRGTIIPEYQAPKNVSVLESAVIYNETLNNKAISAQIIDLAVKGYLRIEEKEKDKLIGKSKEFNFTLLKDYDNQLSPEEKTLLDSLFSHQPSGTTIALDDLKKKFYKEVNSLDQQLMDSVEKEKYFVKNPKKAKATYITIGSVMLFGSFTFIASGFGIGFMLAGILCLVFAFIMPARTEQGLRIKEYLEGLKLYIKTAEKDRFEYLQSTQGAERIKIADSDNISKIKLFEDLLPYAVLFGMEKSWAAQFEGIYAQAPNWYSGNCAAFNTAYLVGSISSFNSAASTAFAAPSSSGGSGLGGGAGGGGGGGGGGGW